MKESLKDDNFPFFETKAKFTDRRWVGKENYPTENRENQKLMYIVSILFFQILFFK